MTWRSSFWFDEMAIFKKMTWLCLRPGSQWSCAVAEIVRRDAGRKIQGAHNSPNDLDFLQLINQKTTSWVSLMFTVYTPWPVNEHRIPKLQMSETGTTCERRLWTKCTCSDSDFIWLWCPQQNCNRKWLAAKNVFSASLPSSRTKMPQSWIFWICWMFHLSILLVQSVFESVTP